MVTISFDAEGLDDDVREQVESFFVRVAADLSNYLGDEVPVGATANLRNSVQVLGYDSRDGSIVVAVRSEYAQVVREGREPGQFPDMEPLRKWVDRVIGAEEYLSWGGEGWEVNSLDEATFLVGRSIAESGTDPNPYLERSIERLKRKYS